jgi:hypothetical protein
MLLDKARAAAVFHIGCLSPNTLNLLRKDCFGRI